MHGAGGPLWDPVLPLLGGAHVVSLSGMDDPGTGVARHAADVVAFLEAGDLREVVLVGHSYGGMPITAAAELAPERLARLVYLDAFAPRDGECAFDSRPDLAPYLRGWAVGGVIPPLDPEFAGVDTEEQAAFVRERMSSTPLRCFEEAVSLRSEARRRSREATSFAGARGTGGAPRNAGRRGGTTTSSRPRTWRCSPRLRSWRSS